MSREYKIPCVYQMWGILNITADSLEEAKRIAREESPLPYNAEYIDDSFEIDEEGIRLHNEL